MFYNIYSQIILNNKNEYEKVFSINKIPEDNQIKDNIKTIKKKRLSTFETDYNNNRSYCENIFIDNNKNYINIDDIDKIINIIIENGFTIDTEITKLLTQNKKIIPNSDKILVFVIKQI
jgi:hypothetical protein